ncbi:hypothetical protein AHAS_Ahas17G0170300 [Arachis hypogaea]
MASIPLDIALQNQLQPSKIRPKEPQNREPRDFLMKSRAGTYAYTQLNPKQGVALGLNASGDIFPDKVSYEELSEEDKLIFRRFQRNTLKNLTDDMMSIGVENEEDRLMFKRIFILYIQMAFLLPTTINKEKKNPGLPWISNWNKELLVARMRAKINGYMRQGKHSRCCQDLTSVQSSKPKAGVQRQLPTTFLALDAQKGAAGIQRLKPAFNAQEGRLIHDFVGDFSKHQLSRDHQGDELQELHPRSDWAHTNSGVRLEGGRLVATDLVLITYSLPWKESFTFGEDSKKDLQDRHCLIQADNLHGIDPHSPNALAGSVVRVNWDKESLFKPDPEPEKNLRRRLQQVRAQHSRGNLRKIFEQETENTDTVDNPNDGGEARKVLGDYTAPTSNFYGRSISIPAIRANKFELKSQLVSLMQHNCKFYELPLEDPHQFLSEFLQICDTVKTNGVDPEVYRLMLFPFAVRDRARIWLDSQPKESLDSWKKLVNAFSTKFYPPQKISKLRLEVQTFRQKEGESLYEVWERYKQLIRRCPPDMLSEWSILGIFSDGLSQISKMSLDSSAGGSLHLKKMPEEAK